MFSMQLKVYFSLIQCTIFYNQYKFVVAMIGNVRPVRENEFPSVVSIMQLTNATVRGPMERHHRCTGTLISKQDVMTAEHCLRDTFIEGFKVMIGSHDLHNATEFFPLFIWTYEHWMLFKNREIDLSQHDIGIVKIIGNIPDAVEFSPRGNIAPEHLFGLDVIMVGWGRLVDNRVPRMLHAGVVKILSFEECEGKFFNITGRHSPLDKRYLCSAGIPPAVLNSGDSGGPLMFYGTVVAVNSAVCPDVDGPVQPYLLNLHLSLRYYNEYIEDMLANFHTNF